jgi:alkylhydroperoxidase/carboxymuconolactone decarboxylase family protein YurZ
MKVLAAAAMSLSLLLAFYAGWPSAVTAASVAKEVFSKP